MVFKGEERRGEERDEEAAIYSTRTDCA